MVGTNGFNGFFIAGMGNNCIHKGAAFVCISVTNQVYMICCLSHMFKIIDNAVVIGKFFPEIITQEKFRSLQFFSEKSKVAK